MRIVFMGTPEFAVPSLKALLGSEHQVIAVVTRPDRPRGRGQQVSPSPIKRVALEHGITCLQPEDLEEPEFIAQLRGFWPDLLVVVAFRMLPKVVFQIPPLGAINLHPSLLPRYRGAAPIQWAIINGETETGVTTFFIDEGLDTGRIILQRRVSIGEEETAGELHNRLATIGAEVLLETVALIATGEPPRIAQDETQASPAPKLRKEDCWIDWSRRAIELKNLIRGLCPFPGAQTEVGGWMLKVYRAAVVDGDAVIDPPGRVVSIPHGEGGIVVATGRGLLALLEVQPAGRRKMTGAEFARGHRIKEGDLLGRKKP